MRPGEALVRLLYERGISSIASIVAPLNKRFLRNPFQETAVHMLVKDTKVDTRRGLKSRKWFSVKVDDRIIHYMWRGGEEVSDSTHAREGTLSREDLEPMLDEVPVIGVYMGFAYIHTPKEFKKLRLQLWDSLNAIRYFLWDRHLVLIDNPIKSIKPNDFVTEMSMKEFEKKYKTIVLFDPNAERSVSRDELLSADAFVFGGIIDKEVPRPGLTSHIPCTKCLKRRIMLRGSIIGVPQNINKLIYAVLRARFELDGDIEKAIIEVMGEREKRWRLMWEAIWAHRRGEDPLERVIKMAKLLNASDKVVIRALKMSGIGGGKLVEKLQAINRGKD